MPRIMTYNVHRCVGAGGKPDPRRIAEVIAHCDPDIVALQELDVGRMRTGGIDQAQNLALLLGMSSHFHPALRVEEEQYGDAILSKFPMRLIKAGPLPGILKLEPRGALWTAIDVGHAEVQVLNTHLSLAPHERLAQVDALLGPDWTGDPAFRDPSILLGDFNATRRSRAYRRLVSRFRDAPLELRRRPARTFPARLPMLRIDHVFCSPSVKIMDVETPRTSLVRRASDHLPLVMTFEVDQPA